ncbi:DNA fragmentation factor subunit beta-like [Antedon mediterranea]|uniref:DNA fragmentation factor subunit beta-like n=1 Tax=Antedon mediterranea TaxID=105859 RepID=UPI003AF59CEB
MKKACKIRTLSGSTKKGIVVKDLRDLVKRGCQILQICDADFKGVYEEDQTEVVDNEYFQQLPSNTVFVFLEEEEEFPGDFSLFLKTLEGVMQEDESAKEIRSFLRSTADLGDMYNVIASVSASWNTNNEETREKDPDWFQGLDKRFKTKSAVMRDRAKNRIRGYLDTAKTYFKNQDKTTAKLATEILKQFEDELRYNEYFCSLFDRSAPIKGPQPPLCNKEGWFGCQGVYNEATCQFFHTLNPYSSRQYFIIFSTWNLDHIIEKSRQVLPDLQAALTSKKKGQVVNTDYFFRLLFTTQNFKLVHIVCHDKGVHTGKKTDKRQWYIRK